MGLAVLRDISLLWLIFLALISVLPFAVVFFFAVRGMHRLRQLAKIYLPIAQEKTKFLADKTEEISQQVVAPIITVESKAAQVSGTTKAIFGRRNSA
jgi:hypothetical protein